ncbi:putative shikimate O-hydroxycinnamoyltransferase [Helianthus anomalus]
MNHMVVDRSSYGHYFNSWSKVFRSKMEYNLLNLISRPSVDGFRKDLTRSSHPRLLVQDQFIDILKRSLLGERIFRFSPDSLSKLVAKVNYDCNTTKISTLMSLSVLVWRCVTRAPRLLSERETRCRMDVDNRKRLCSPLPETYFGNAKETNKWSILMVEFDIKGFFFFSFLFFSNNNLTFVVFFKLTNSSPNHKHSNDTP